MRETGLGMGEVTGTAAEIARPQHRLGAPPPLARRPLREVTVAAQMTTRVEISRSRAYNGCLVSDVELLEDAISD